MPSWEYKIAKQPLGGFAEDIEEMLNELGAQGWRLMQMPEDGDLSWYWFEREVGTRLILGD